MYTAFHRLLDEFDLSIDPALPYSRATTGNEYTAVVDLPGAAKADIRVRLVPESRFLDILVKEKTVAKFLVPRGFSLTAMASVYVDGRLRITAPKDPQSVVDITVR